MGIRKLMGAGAGILASGVVIGFAAGAAFAMAVAEKLAMDDDDGFDGSDICDGGCGCSCGCHKAEDPPAQADKDESYLFEEEDPDFGPVPSDDGTLGEIHDAEADKAAEAAFEAAVEMEDAGRPCGPVEQCGGCRGYGSGDPCPYGDPPCGCDEDDCV